MCAMFFSARCRDDGEGAKVEKPGPGKAWSRTSRWRPISDLGNLYTVEISGRKRLLYPTPVLRF